MTYKLSFLPDAIKDMKSLEGSQRILVDKSIKKILSNPLPKNRGGYGTPLSNLAKYKLAGFLRVKLKKSGLRIIYQLKEEDGEVIVIIIGARVDSRVYKEAEKRISKIDDDI